MFTGYFEKNKKRLSKKARGRYQNLSEEEKGRILVSDIELFLKKKKKRSINMVVNHIKIF